MNCIFRVMKIRLNIFSSAFIVIFAILQVQPVFQNYDVQGVIAGRAAEPVKPSCPMKAKSTCSKNKCHKSKPDPNENKDCTNNGCNPFVPCSVGFCCYLVENFFSYSTYNVITRQKLSIFNDNRTSTGLSDCWHPPEMIS